MTPATRTNLSKEIIKEVTYLQKSMMPEKATTRRTTTRTKIRIRLKMSMKLNTSLRIPSSMRATI